MTGTRLLKKSVLLLKIRIKLKDKKSDKFIINIVLKYRKKWDLFPWNFFQKILFQLAGTVKISYIEYII